MTSSPSIPILQPPEIMGLKLIVDLHPHLKYVYPGCGQFDNFVKRTRVIAEDMRFRKGLDSDQIDPAMWQAYVEKVCDPPAHQRLLDYDGCWPLRAIFNLRAKNYIRNQYYHHKASHEEAPEPSATTSDHLHSTTHPLASGGSLSTPRRSPRTSTQATSMKTPAVVKSEHPSPHKRYTPSLKPYVLVGQRSPRKVGQVQPTVRRLGPTTKTTSSKPTHRVKHPNSPLVAHVGCLDCGHGPGVIGPRTVLSPTVGEEDPEHLQVLADAGLVDDAHLNIFWQWPSGHRVKFVRELPTTPFDRQILLQKLGGPAPSAVPRKSGTEAPGLLPTQIPQTSELNVVSQAPRTFSGVLQPSKEAEQTLTDPKQPIELLCTAMELGPSPKSFNEVLRFFRRDGFPYLCSFHPSDDEIEKAVKAIAREKLLFERYENHWPIRFLIKRIVRKQISGSTPDACGSPSHWIRPSLDTSTQQQPVIPSGPPRIVYDCPWHAGPDISRVASNIQLLLHHRGLSEFTPIFAYLGLRTDTDFVRFCSFSPEAKVVLVENTRQQLGRSVRLNAFQSMALELEFTAGGE